MRSPRGISLEVEAGDAVFYPLGVWHSEAVESTLTAGFLFMAFRADFGVLPDAVVRVVDRHGRIYHAETGRTPMRDVREIRARYARQLIVSTDAPLKQIALRAGLSKGPVLYETFRRVFGRPPARFRKSEDTIR